MATNMGWMKKAGYRTAVLGAVLAGALATGCASGGDTYEEFKSAVDSGATCSELFYQRGNFAGRRDLERIDSDLERIGCEDRNSERTE